VRGRSRLEEVPCPVLAVPARASVSGSVTKGNPWHSDGVAGVCSDQEVNHEPSCSRPCCAHVDGRRSCRFVSGK
jgi:hypothetical protein